MLAGIYLGKHEIYGVLPCSTTLSAGGTSVQFCCNPVYFGVPLASTELSVADSVVSGVVRSVGYSQLSGTCSTHDTKNQSQIA